MRIKTLLLAGLTALSSVFLSAAQLPRPPLFTLHHVGDGVWAAIAPDGSKAGANTGFVIGQDGVAVIDSFQNVDAARDLLADIRKRTSLPIRFLVNTHYHLDHMTGNGVFAAAGAVILANRHVRAWAHTENLKFFGPSPTAADRARVAAIVLPSVVYGSGIDLYLGKRELLVRHMPGHTGSDSVIIVPDANVVFTGDLLWNTHLPNLIDASTKPWIQSLDTLGARYPTATFVPGHGDVARLANLQAFRGYLVSLREAVASGLAHGQSGAALVAALTPALERKYGSWGFFQYFLKPDILLTAEELQGRKRLPGGRVN
ncbi:MAG TPA: MBL fold metallo-hydrolase [Vicinamibacterales bacterium]|nr:MBL fold metallo-hydrolase [Vicinamibacterales bacterium]